MGRRVRKEGRERRVGKKSDAKKSEEKRREDL
jgi:hypothetical protein